MKLNVKTWIKALKHICANRRTLYNNNFPFNCGYLWSTGYLSFDCIGLIKSTIREPEISYKTKPAGYFVPVDVKIIPDTSEIGLLSLCSDVTWNDFSEMITGEYLYMAGHAGIYFEGNPDVNVIECTSDWGGGVVASWVDPDGTRRSWKQGKPFGRKWEAHGKLDKYIDYNIKKKSIAVIAREVIAGEWGNYPERKARLEKAGYNYQTVQKKVNELLKK